MQDRFADWRGQLPAAWREFLPDSVAPAFAEIPDDTEIDDQEAVIPGGPSQCSPSRRHASASSCLAKIPIPSRLKPPAAPSIPAA